MPLATVYLHLGGADCVVPPAQQLKPPGPDSEPSKERSHNESTQVHDAEPPADECSMRHNQEHANTRQPNFPPSTEQLLSCTAKSVTVLRAMDTALDLPINSRLPVTSNCTSPMVYKAELNSSAATSVPCTAEVPDQPAQVQLTPEPHPVLQGEYVIHNFLSVAEATSLIEFVDTAMPTWKDSNFNGRHRYAAHTSSSTQRQFC